MLEIFCPAGTIKAPPKSLVFDFDGTLSTLRCGWESFMSAFMIETLGAGRESDDAAAEAVSGRVMRYIGESAGIQTIFQMQWLAEQVRAAGLAPQDPWVYKAEYNRRLMQNVSLRRGSVLHGEKSAAAYQIAGSRPFLEALRAKKVTLYVVSGTDQEDVAAEAKILGLDRFFKEIAGAPPGQARCSKEWVIHRLLRDGGLKGEELAVIGDGKVEMAIAREVGAAALGVASDEDLRSGVNPVKRERLLAAGAQAITGDFLAIREILDWLKLA